MDARQAPRRLTGRGDRFSLVFVDPPYDSGLALEMLEALEASTVLDDNGVIVVECGAMESLPAEVGGLHRADERRYGGTTLSFYRGAPSASDPS
jgi:16S rRNA G966 N2-methylase RsmD